MEKANTLLSIEESRNSAQEKSEAKAVASKCYECHEPGHFARNCPKRKPGSDSGNDKTTRSNTGGDKKTQGEGLVGEALTSTGNEETGRQEWILDTGASDHMCNVKQWFTTYEEFDEPRSVRVGDGSSIHADNELEEGDRYSESEPEEFQDDGEFNGDPDFVPVVSDDSEDENDNEDDQYETLDEESEDTEEEHASDTWQEDVKPIIDFYFDTENSGPIDMDTSSRINIFKKMFEDEILDMLITSTNIYGEKLCQLNKPSTRNRRILSFKKTNILEMSQFLGLCLLKSQVRAPSIRHLFSKAAETDGKTSSIVKRLMAPYLNRGHHLYMDNFYNSVGLSKELLELKTHTTGTLRRNRKENPKVVVNQKLRRGEYIWRRSGDVILRRKLFVYNERFRNRRMPNHKTFANMERRLRETGKFVPITADCGHASTCLTTWAKQSQERVPISDKVIMKYIVTGAGDPEMRRSPAIFEYEQQLLRRMKNYEDTLEQKHRREVTIDRSGTFEKKAINKTSTGRDEDSIPKGDQVNMRCYNCGHKGHQAKDCIDKEKGSKCNHDEDFEFLFTSSSEDDWSHAEMDDTDSSLDIEDTERRSLVRCQNYVEEIVPLYDDNQFRQHFRMSRATCIYIINQIKEANVLSSTNFGRPSISAGKAFL
ncbi:hypothetical protein CBL_10558 [Carabus blaptoides fortunei]